MPAQHVQVVLAVLPDLGDLRIGKDRSQGIQHDLARQLLDRARAVMRHRDVRRVAGFDRQTQPDQARAQRVERIGFGIERELARLHQPGDPRVELFTGQHRLVGPWT